MSLRDRIRIQSKDVPRRLYRKFGILANPFPASNQTSANPHHPVDADDEVETRIVAFLRDRRSQVVVVEGTQGVGKTNFLNHFEAEIRTAMAEQKGYYMVRYLADPEPSFEGTTRRLFEELGTRHLERLAKRIKKNRAAIREARSHDMQTALGRITNSPSEEIRDLMMQWLLGLRVLKVHRTELGVQFRLDTVESKTAAIRDLIQVSAAAGALKGVFLLLDELEKQDGVLGPTAVVRYLSALRSIVDALPQHLFLMIGITPEALRRYSATLPALRGRLQNQVTLHPLGDVAEARRLAKFYLDSARHDAQARFEAEGGRDSVVSRSQFDDCYEELFERAERVGDTGVRQREYLHRLHILAEEAMQQVVEA